MYTVRPQLAEALGACSTVSAPGFDLEVESIKCVIEEEVRNNVAKSTSRAVHVWLDEMYRAVKLSNMVPVCC